MSVRRLANESVQPEGFEFSPENMKWAKETLKKYPEGRQVSAVIPFLMRAQEQEGWVTRASIEYVADMLDMPYIRALEIATFYTQFQLQPVGTKAHIQVCGTTPCMLRGSGDLIKLCKKRINEKPFETNSDGTLSWEEVECQGACVNAPMVMIFKDTYEDLTPERLDEIINAFEAGRGDEIVPGPQIERHYSAPEGGRVTLMDGAVESKGGGHSGKGIAPVKISQAVASENADKDGKKSDGDATGAQKSDSKAEAASTAAASTSSAAVGLVGAVSSSNDASSDKSDADAKADSDAAATSAAAAKSGAAETSKKVESKSEAKASAASGKADDKKAEAKSADDKAETKKASSKSEDNKPSLDDKNRPPQMVKPTGDADDLKLISGVGPVLEGKLHELGIFSFEQISKWKKAEREWVDGYLSFKGRIDRDEWVKQAKALAKGGAEEYRKVFGKDPR